jgi:predicted metal-dependent peptidase
MIQRLVSSASKTLMLREPYYGLFLIGLNKTYRDDIPTAGVSKNGINTQLAINPKFFEGLNEKHRIGLMKHELLHIALGHLFIRDNYADKKLFNIAADLEINQYILSDYLPDGGITLDTFPELNLPDRAGTKKYYELLSQAKQQGGSDTLSNILNEMDGESQYNHTTWDEFEGIPEAEQKVIQKQVEHQLKESAKVIKKQRGTIPGELSDILERMFHVEPPKFDWRGYLRRFVGNSIKSYTKKLRRKYNKRYAGNPGLKIKFKNHILVGIDTSGSVNNDELKEFHSELIHMHRTGHMITVIQCDTRVRSVELFNPKKDFNIHGRGGTDFQPVIDHYNKENKYTALIYLTDGEAYNPANCPNNTLWVLSSISTMNNKLPGRVIKLN